jgi:hypothetical protein
MTYFLECNMFVMSFGSFQTSGFYFTPTSFLCCQFMHSRFTDHVSSVDTSRALESVVWAPPPHFSPHEPKASSHAT